MGEVCATSKPDTVRESIPSKTETRCTVMVWLQLDQPGEPCDFGSGIDDPLTSPKSGRSRLTAVAIREHDRYLSSAGDKRGCTRRRQLLRFGVDLKSTVRLLRLWARASCVPSLPRPRATQRS